MKKSVNLKNTRKSNYSIVGSTFVIDSNDALTINEEDCDKIVNYSLLGNNIVEIFDLKRDVCVTKFYHDLTPMIIIDHNDFYGDEVFFDKSEFHHKFINDLEKVTSLYERVADEYIEFIKHTGCYFYDVAGNNILVNSDYSEFKIIDVFSVRKLPKKVKLTFDPISIFLSGYVSFWGKMLPPKKKYSNKKLVEFLNKTNLQKINDEIFSKIERKVYVR